MTDGRNGRLPFAHSASVPNVTPNLIPPSPSERSNSRHVGTNAAAASVSSDSLRSLPLWIYNGFRTVPSGLRPACFAIGLWCNTFPYQGAHIPTIDYEPHGRYVDVCGRRRPSRASLQAGPAEYIRALVRPVSPKPSFISSVDLDLSGP